jgi:hypothetical protein
MKAQAPDDLSEKDKTADRRVKSVNFTDLELFDYAMGRATNLYGGNFSAYVIALIERDRSLGDSRKLYLDLEHRILGLIRPFGGQPLPQNHSFDFEVPELNLLIEAKSRFPRERQMEYQLLSSLQRASITEPGVRIALVYPTELAEAEKERFRQLEAAGVEGLRVCDLAEFQRYLEALADPSTEDLEQRLRSQQDADARLRDKVRSKKSD